MLNLKNQKTFAFTAIFTSVVLIVAACAGGGSSSANLTVQGVAATGAPMALANVSLKCADGGIGNTVTDMNGNFTVRLNGLLPCMIQATASDNSAIYHSLATGSGNTATANVTPLTEAVVTQISSDPRNYFASFDSTAAQKLTASMLSDMQAKVIQNLKDNGVDTADVTDILGSKLVAGAKDNTYDHLLDTIGNKTYDVKIIAMNDFHGNIEPPGKSNGGQVTLPDGGSGVKVNVGGAAYVATAIKSLKDAVKNNVVVGAGDLTGASPFASSITHDEATVDVLNQMGLDVTSVGNHEFDNGKTELLRKQNGGCYPVTGDQGKVGVDTCFMDSATGTYSATGNSFSGAKYQYLSANVVDKASNKSLFPATYIKRFGPVSIGFIGLTLKGTPQLVAGNGISDLIFKDEIETINSYAKSLKSGGVQAVVVLIHQGGVSTATAVNDQTCPVSFGDLQLILDGISADIDVVVSGHSHQEYVCKVTGKSSQKEILVTQTGFYGEALTDINLKIDPKKGVISKSANTVPVIQADTNSGVTIPQAFKTFAKDATVDALVTNYVAKSVNLGKTQVGSIQSNISIAYFGTTTGRDESAEGAFGGLVADAYVNGIPGGADFAAINPGGLRASLTCADGVTPPCPVTYKDLQTARPYTNTLVKVNLTGSQIIRLLEQQWEAPNCTGKYNPNTFQYGRWLQVSKELTYSFDNSVNPWISGNTPTNCAAAGTGNRVKMDTVKIRGVNLDLNKTYTVATNNFLIGGGDNFTVFKSGTNIVDTQIVDNNILIDYLKSNSPLTAPMPRITRLN